MRFFILLTFLVFSMLVSAQYKTPNTPTPPTPPNLNGVTTPPPSSADGAASGKTTSTTRTSSSSSSHVSTSRSHSSRSTISVHESDLSYSLKAEFDSNKWHELQEFLTDTMDNTYKIESNKSLQWWKKGNGDSVAYSFLLTTNSLKITIDKKLNSKAVTERLVEVAETLSNTISSH